MTLTLLFVALSGYKGGLRAVVWRHFGWSTLTGIGLVVAQCVTDSAGPCWMAIADANGHSAAFSPLLSWADLEFGADLPACLLGDLVDYGPAIRGPLAPAIGEMERRGGRLVSEGGGHHGRH